MANYANIVNRAVATIIDHIIVYAIAAIISLPFGFQAFAMDYAGVINPLALAGTMMTMMAVGAVVFILYFTYMEGSTGQTLGKRLLGIKVIKEKGKMTYADAFIRTILRIIDGILVYVLGLIVILVSQKKQRIGDMAAKTLVVKA